MSEVYELRTARSAERLVAIVRRIERAVKLGVILLGAVLVVVIAVLIRMVV